MKMFCAAGTVLLLASQIVSRAYAAELCEARDYYNLAEATGNCSIKSDRGAGKNDTQELMFELLKNYPYEQKDKFALLLQRKIDLVGTYIAKQQHQEQTGRVKTIVGILEQVSQDLAAQRGMVLAATQDTWEGVRYQARKALEDASKKMREVE